MMNIFFFIWVEQLIYKYDCRIYILNYINRSNRHVFESVSITSDRQICKFENYCEIFISSYKINRK